MKNIYLKFLRSILPIVGLLLSLSASAEGVNIKGHVKDVAGEAIIGANIVVKGTTLGTISDYDGNFVLEVPANSTLNITCIGYKGKEVKVAKQTILSIVLEEDTELLDEVVVIGYGQMKKGDIAGSLLTMKPDELNRGRLVTAQDALVGKIAGVNVVPGSGAPGDGGTIRIRMGASLSASNDPLIVIDGIPVTSTSISAINPQDIASFTVLKDASATAIYGSRASNGVIVITTKKGNADGTQKMKFSYNGNFTVSEVYKYMDVLGTDEYRDAFAKYANAPDDFKLGDASTDWQKEIYRTAFGTDHNLSLTGGIKSMPYRVSVGYTNQNGIIKANNYERFNASVGLSPKFFDKHLSIDVNIKGSIENNESVSTGVIGSAISFDPTRPVRENYPDNVGLGYFTWMVGGAPIVIAPNNPVAELELSDKQNKTKRSIGSAVIDYKIHGLEDLHLNLSLGYDIQRKTTDEMIPQFAPAMYTSNQKDGTGKVYAYVQDKKNTLLDIYANYDKEIKKHHINAMAGYGWQRFWYKNHDSTSDTFGKELSSPTHGEGELYLLSFYGRLNYSFAQRYMLTATLRSDASSRFSKDTRWGYFPSVAAAWRVNEEAFLKNVKAISDLKLRFSYGQTGQQDIGSYYQHLSTYTASYDEVRYQFGNDWQTTYRPNGYDPKIKWETTETYNIGIDYGFLNNRISGSVDYYWRTTKDLLNKIYVPAGSNFTNIIETNIGNMDSKGLEMSLTAIPVKTKDWEWTVSGNFTWNTSEIKKLNTIDTDNNYIKTGDAGGTGKYLQIHKVGETPNTFFLLQQAYDDNGKPLDGKYVAKDGSITTSEEDANKYITGKSSKAPYYYGVSTRLTYKKWDLGINGHGSAGNYVYNYVAASQSFDSFYSANGTSGNVLRSTLDTGFAQQRLYTDYFLEKGNFFRIDNITLGHTFNRLWNSSSSLRLSFSVQNVATITKYSGIDPEIYSGIDKNVYQRPRIYMLGLNLNF